MNLAKAKEIGKDLLTEGPQFPPDDRRDAVKLLIEVATWIQLCRVTSPGVVPTLFHGETKD